MTSKWFMAICVAVATLMVLPSVLAVDVSLGGATGSSTTSIQSVKGTSANVQNSLNSQSLTGSGQLLSDWGAGAVNQYYEWNSWDGLQKAAAYAEIENSGKYSYTFAGTSSKTTASASLKLYAEGTAAADRFLLGGFAYNPTDYAGAFVYGNDFGKMNYKNSLSASPTKVSASQTLDGTNFDGLHAEVWAERGNIANEITTEEGIFDPVAGTGIWPTNILGGLGYSSLANWVPGSNEIYSGQTLDIAAGTLSNLNSKKPYAATASLTANTAASSQSAGVSGASAGTANVVFESLAMTGDVSAVGNEAYLADSKLTVNALTYKTNNAVLSSSSKATATQASATQTMSVSKADSIDRTTMSTDYFNDFTSQTTAVANNAVGVSASMSGTDSATAKAGSTSTTQKLTMTGATLSRGIYSNYDAATVTPTSAACHAMSYATVAPGATAKASTFSGTTTTTATLTGSSILTAGKYKAVIGANAAFDMGSLGDNGLSNINTVEPQRIPTVQTTYYFTEKRKITPTTVA